MVKSALGIIHSGHVDPTSPVAAKERIHFFLGVMAPLFLLLPVAGVVASLAQVGPLLSSKAVTPDINRINPLTGFQRLFSVRSLVELGKAMAKAGLVALIVSRTYADSMPEILDLASIGDLGAATPQLATPAKTRLDVRL